MTIRIKFILTHFHCIHITVPPCLQCWFLTKCANIRRRCEWLASCCSPLCLCCPYQLGIMDYACEDVTSFVCIHFMCISVYWYMFSRAVSRSVVWGLDFCLLLLLVSSLIMHAIRILIFVSQELDPPHPSVTGQIVYIACVVHFTVHYILFTIGDRCCVNHYQSSCWTLYDVSGPWWCPAQSSVRLSISKCTSWPLPQIGC